MKSWLAVFFKSICLISLIFSLLLLVGGSFGVMVRELNASRLMISIAVLLGISLLSFFLHQQFLDPKELRAAVAGGKMGLKKVSRENAHSLYRGLALLGIMFFGMMAFGALTTVLSEGRKSERSDVLVLLLLVGLLSAGATYLCYRVRKKFS